MGIRGSLAPVVTDILRQLQQLTASGHYIAFQWVPGHCGIVGNEEADNAAEAAHRSSTAMQIALSRGDRRLFLAGLLQPLAQQQWCQDVTGSSLLHLVDPTQTFCVPGCLPRPISSVLHRLRLNVAFTPQFKCMIGCGSSALCPHCGVVADINHVLIDCIQHATRRAALRVQLSMVSSKPLSLPALLGPYDSPAQQCKVLQLFANFLADTELLGTL